MAHVTTAPQNVANKFDDGDPTIPRLGTELVAADLNMWSDEINSVVTTAGVALNPADNTQMSQVVMNLTTPQTTTAGKTFQGQAGSGDDGEHGVTSTGGAGASSFDGGAGVKGIGGAAGSGGNQGPGGWFKPNSGNTATAVRADGAVDLGNAGDAANPNGSVHEVNRRNVEKGHVSILLNISASPTWQAADAYNIASVVARGGSDKDVVVTLTKNVGNNVVPVVMIGKSGGGLGAFFVQLKTAASSGFSVEIINGSGTVQDPTGGGMNNVWLTAILAGQ